jgi:acylphosphatase
VIVERARVHLLVSGRVQGVAYRAATVEQARVLGLRGWVRNLPDGRVEAEAEGEREDVEALVAWCRRGPPAARVEGLAVTWSAPVGGPGSFQITR